jgi:hypothetical protein
MSPRETIARVAAATEKSGRLLSAVNSLVRRILFFCQGKLVTTETFKISYDGPAVQDGTMQVHQFAQALLGVGDLVSDANKTLNGDQARVEVRVRADFVAGSFEVTLQMVQSLVVGVAIPLFTTPGASATANLATILGFTKATADSLFSAIRWLKGAKPEVLTPEQVQPEVRASLDLKTGDFVLRANGAELKVSFPVATLVADKRVREDTQRIFAPLADDGVDSCELLDEKGGVVEQVSRSELSWFKPPTEEPRPDLASKLLLPPQDAEQIVTVVRPMLFPLSDEQGKKALGPPEWNLFDGSDRFSSRIEDQDFLQKVNVGALRFGHGDRLRVMIRTTQREDANGRLHKERLVMKVLEFLPSTPLHQPELFPR